MLNSFDLLHAGSCAPCKCLGDGHCASSLELRPEGLTNLHAAGAFGRPAPCIVLPARLLWSLIACSLQSAVVAPASYLQVVPYNVCHTLACGDERTAHAVRPKLNLHPIWEQKILPPVLFTPILNRLFNHCRTFAEDSTQGGCELLARGPLGRVAAQHAQHGCPDRAQLSLDVGSEAVALPRQWILPKQLPLHL